MDSRQKGKVWRNRESIGSCKRQTDRQRQSWVVVSDKLSDTQSKTEFVLWRVVRDRHTDRRKDKQTDKDRVRSMGSCK